MYENYFGLQHRPFSAVPRVDDYFPAESIESARSTLIRVAQRGEGVGLLIGAPGTGKTLLCQRIEHDVEGLFRVVILGQGHGVESRRELYQSILFELGLKYAGLDEGELRLALRRHLTRAGSTLPLLLIVDDAQRLEIELLEELRRLTEISRSGEGTVQLILAGSAGLEEKFAHPALESFNQRIAARCYLETFTHDETQGYLAARIGTAGGVLDSLITAEAVESIYRATDGVPRLINQISDQALMLAASQNSRPIWGKLVDQAWAELQQLPAPWNETHRDSGSESSAGVVEFGSLDGGDDPCAEPPASAAEPQGVELVETAPLAACEEEQTFDTQDRVEPQSESATLHELVLPSDLEDMFRELAEGDTAAGPGEDTQVSGGLPLEFETGEASEITVAASRPVSETVGEFEEEEIVLDRYAALDSRGDRPLTRVYSVEGRELAQLLQARLPAETAPAAETPVETRQQEPSSTPDAIVREIEIEVDLPVQFAPEAAGLSTDDLEMELPIEFEPEPDPADEAVVDEEPDVIPALSSHDESPDEADDEDADLIVIDEDGEHQAGTVPLVAVAPVRREEYRTMFSRLRRGRVPS